MSFDVANFFNLDNVRAQAAVFDGCQNVWDVLKNIAPYVRERCRNESRRHRRGGRAPHRQRDDRGRARSSAPARTSRAPRSSGRTREIRPHARSSAATSLIGDRCIVGNATELKNTLMLDGAMAPHYNYCGDSVLGNDVNLGAGTKLSNWKIADDKNVRLLHGEEWIDTGLQEVRGDPRGQLPDRLQLGA